jgi:basic amino acid/polyamine antiporter, APA family
MARKVGGFQRVLDAPALFSVAYGEIAASLYFALGIVAAYALGLTPLVLLGAGIFFLLVSLSYAEGTAALSETGGAATFVRRAYNDAAGFVTGWALFLDYLIVIALSALFAPHYLGIALGIDALREGPADLLVAVAVIAGIALVRLTRRTQLHSAGLAVAGLDLAVQLLLVVLGLALLLSPDALTAGIDVGDAPTWDDLAFALPFALLAFTGLETVANLAEETREPGRTVPRSLFSAIGLVVLLTVLVAAVGLSAFPVEDGRTALGEEWLKAPLAGIATALQGELPGVVGDALLVAVGLAGALVLLAAATTSFSGFTRLAYSLGEHGQLPRSLGRPNRRTLVSPLAIVAAAVLAIVLLLGATLRADDDVASLASLYSFGVLVAFAAAQLAVIRLRVTEPDLERPFRAPILAPLLGLPLALALLVVALVTHPGARYAGPAWVALGLVLYLVVRRRERRGLFERVGAAPAPPTGVDFRRVLVPMKLGRIGEEMAATAIALAKERGAEVHAVYVIQVPLAHELEAPLPDLEEQAAASLAEAALLGDDEGVRVQTSSVRSRSIGRSIVELAHERDADLIVLGSSPRWRRQSAFFSPTVDYVLTHAPCEVLVVAFPQGVLEDVT